jgi:hypothetical protein
LPPIGTRNANSRAFGSPSSSENRDEYTLEWFDAPEYPAFKSRPQNIAVLHPEFRLSGK